MTCLEEDCGEGRKKARESKNSEDSLACEKTSILILLYSCLLFFVIKALAGNFYFTLLFSIIHRGGWFTDSPPTFGRKNKKHIILSSLKLSLVAEVICVLLVFSVTPFKIDQNKNQIPSIDKVQNLENERRYIYKDPRQDSGQRNISYMRYPKKMFDPNL